jgi:hypothetical protein
VDRERHVGTVCRALLCALPQRRQLQCAHISPASLACSILTPVAGKDTSTPRLTHILRPNVTCSDPATRATLAPPPPTDFGLSSLSSSHDSGLPSSLSDVQSIDGVSDVLSEVDFASDPELPAHRRAQPTSSASDADADAETGSSIDAGGRLVASWAGCQRSSRATTVGERRASTTTFSNRPISFCFQVCHLFA